MKPRTALHVCSGKPQSVFTSHSQIDRRCTLQQLHDTIVFPEADNCTCVPCLLDVTASCSIRRTAESSWLETGTRISTVSEWSASKFRTRHHLRQSRMYVCLLTS